ncbi:MAG: type I DNA topoisomerase [Clostridiales bacterium]|jgi:DNA topoisomerase-1|nr:type I DNA topoisomerase [Clostridiales bacterium]
MNLIIIEGAGKKETIEKYLGSGYKVFATKGHIRDLPIKRFGVNIKKNFEPKYEILQDKQDIVDKLLKEAKAAEKVLLATDPDREGEAISWHLANILKLDQKAPVRVVFNEISKKAVQSALLAPRPVDGSLVDAQQARRVLDRIVGYKLSPMLSRKIQNNLSAGRVQSVTLRLVVDREREIMDFKPEEYWTFFSILQVQDTKQADVMLKFKASLHSYQGKKIKIANKDELEQVLSAIDSKQYLVTNVKKSVTTQRPPAPFVTSTMQQDALNKLSMSLKQTSLAAQSLYEGVELGDKGKVALVTYIRTDSTRVAADAQAETKDYVIKNYGEQYAPQKFNFYASKKGAQDAHECIRPIDITLTPDSVKAHLSQPNYKLYKLIYERFLASQMTPAQYNSVSVDIDCSGYNFRATGRTLLFDGFTAVYSAYAEKKEDSDDDQSTMLPELKEGDRPLWIEYKYEQKFTKPPARYNEASLVKKMEESGIGRPATYSPTVATIIARKYVEKDGKVLMPTELGFKCTDMLIKYFPEVMDLEFTAFMEQSLDDIEDGGKQWQSVIDEFYNGEGGFAKKLDEAMGDGFSLKEPDEQTDFACEMCGSMMVIKHGRFGKFLSCSAYPNCKHAMQIDQDGNPKAKEPPKVTDTMCEKCGAAMLEREGRYGSFLGCSNYPKCKNIIKLKDESQEQVDLPPCPDCGKPLRKVGFGRRQFYGCTDYPNCKFTSKEIPTNLNA